MTPVFLDTGYVIALEVADDQYHERALEHWHAFLPEPIPVVTTTLIFAEIVTFFNCVGRSDKAQEIGARLLASKRIGIIHLDPDIFRDGWAYMRAHKDKNYSFTDCVSFVVMAREGLHDALAFDKHFTQAGFQRLP